jgi:hypothetical protein
MKIYFILIIGMSLLLMNINPAQDSISTSVIQNGIEASGTFSPSSPPKKKPERIEAGKSCIIDLIESYTISGTLSGKMEFNYRILVKGPCADHLPEHLMKSGLLTESLTVKLKVLLSPEI